MSDRNRLAQFIFATALSIASQNLSNAQVLAVQSFNNLGGGPFGLDPDRTYGWQFTVTGSSISVEKLGYYDHQSDGLLDSHTVGIWDDSGALLTQATVSAGGGTLSSSFRFVDITPLMLTVGETYRLGGWSADVDDPVMAFTTETFAPQITFNSGYQASAGNLGFTFPNEQAAFLNQGVFGPNMAFAVVPEPHEYAILTGLGLALFAILRRTRRQGETSNAVG